MTINLIIGIILAGIVFAIVIPMALRARSTCSTSSAVSACKTFAEAQDIYRRTDWDEDGIYEYALALKGKDSLFESVSGAADIQLIDQAMAMAEGQPGKADPKVGYVFQVLHGANDGKGTINWLDEQGQLIHGYGLSALPAQYDETGRTAFQIDHSGVVYQFDHGKEVQHPQYYDTFSQGWIITE